MDRSGARVLGHRQAPHRLLLFMMQRPGRFGSRQPQGLADHRQAGHRQGEDAGGDKEQRAQGDALIKARQPATPCVEAKSIWCCDWRPDSPGQDFLLWRVPGPAVEQRRRHRDNGDIAATHGRPLRRDPWRAVLRLSNFCGRDTGRMRWIEYQPRRVEVTEFQTLDRSVRNPKPSSPARSQRRLNTCW